MAIRIKHPREHSLVALVVICFLGTIAIITSISTAVLIHEAVVYVPPNGQTIDAAIVALISQQGAIALASIAGLTAMLSSTSPKPAPTPTITGPTGQESVPVTAVNTPSQPVPTDPQPADPAPTPPPTDAMPDPDGADPGLLATSDTGHADLSLLAVVTAAVVLGGLILHLILT